MHANRIASGTVPYQTGYIFFHVIRVFSIVYVIQKTNGMMLLIGIAVGQIQNCHCLECTASDNCQREIYHGILLSPEIGIS